jgi:glycosyltransferase involved in cell wall biosynthesis
VDDPTDVEALAATVEQALAGRERLRRLGLARAALFTWDRTAAVVAGVIREMVD